MIQDPTIRSCRARRASAAARAVLVACTTFVVAGCAGQAPTLQAPASPASPGATGAIDRKPVDIANPDLTFTAASQPVDLYAQIARGANGCWFGAGGPLKKSHIFSADVAPAASGGHAHIALLERDAGLPDLRGPRAYQIVMTPIATGSQVVVANTRLAPEVAQAMGRDVAAWARGETGCLLRTVMPAPPDPAPAAAPAKVAKRPTPKR